MEDAEFVSDKLLLFGVERAIEMEKLISIRCVPLRARARTRSASVDSFLSVSVTRRTY